MSSLPSPVVAALLSLLFPGLGQAYAGARTRGVLLAVPWLLLIVAVVYVIASDSLLEIITGAATMAALLVFGLAVFFYHLAAVLDAYNVALRERQLIGMPTPRGSHAVVALLAAVLLVPYGVLEVYGIQGNDALNVIAPGNSGAIPPPPSWNDDPSPTPGTQPPTASPPPTPATSPTPTGSSPQPTDGGPQSPSPVPPAWGPIDAVWAENGRLDLLLVGADAGPGRTSVRTDTMILLSVEIATGKAAMFGFPRNMINVPLPEESAGAYPGGIFPANELLNALWRRAAEQPGVFAGSDGVGKECQFDFACERGWRALSGAIQNMAGVPLDGIIAVDLNGFARLVDAVGGVWIDVPTRVVEERYRTEDRRLISIDIKPGCRKLDGTLALAYARSREQDSDYQRMRRQQQVLQAVRRQFDPISLLPRVPELLSVARDNLFTTIDRDDIPEMAEVAARVDADRIHQVRFQQQALRHVTQESIRRMRDRVRNIFSESLPEPTPTPRDAERCPPR